MISSTAPAGSCRLIVAGAEDIVPDESKKKKTGLFSFGNDKTLRSYHTGTQPLIVTDTDVTGIKVALIVDRNAKNTDEDAAKAFGAAPSGDDAK